MSLVSRQAISAAKLEAKVGREMPVIVDKVDDEAATCRSMADAPEIDGNVFLDEGFEGLASRRQELLRCALLLQKRKCLLG